MILTLNVHSSRASDFLQPDVLRFRPSVPTQTYRDGLGNWCSRILAPTGALLITADAIIRDAGQVDCVPRGARQVPVEQLPAETLLFLLGSRHCETDCLSDAAWELFGESPPGWDRVQAISEFVHGHVSFSHDHADPQKTARDVLESKAGVGRDFAHLAIALCRCMHIPARYCRGYLADVGVEAVGEPQDFSCWLEVYLEGGWYPVDPRNHAPRAGRILIARGRDAADAAVCTTFGPSTLFGVRVWATDIT